MGAVYEGGRSMTDAIRFHIDRESSGIDFMEGELESVEMYDLNGIRYKVNTTKGIYIIGGKKIIQR